MSQSDWATAFVRIDPTCGIISLRRIGIRPSLIANLASYIDGRENVVKDNGVESSPRDLICVGPQGTSIGVLYYNISSQGCEEELYPDIQIKCLNF